jgi:3-methylcrotonyl-CoA carboxylase alpha subunit
MNTRLQVEHPVTELVTGLDLVRLQLRIAAGEPLPLAQGDIAPRGHAIEVRLYAEDPANGYLPSIGRVAVFAPPRAPGVRVDAGVAAGDEVTMHYDPMLAKLIVYGPDRPAAVERLARALDHFGVLGIATNIPLLRAIAHEPDYRAARTTTAYLEEHSFAELREAGAPPPLVLATAALWEAQAEAVGEAPRSGQFNPWTSAAALGGNAPRRFRYTVADQRHEVTLTPAVSGEGYSVELDGAEYDGGRALRVTIQRDGAVTLFAGDMRATCYLARRGYEVLAGHAGATYRLEKPQPLSVEAAAHAHEVAGGRQTLTAPMAGTVMRVNVAEGDTVEPHQALVVLGAMKMEHAITSPYPAKVVRVPHAAGDVVPGGEVLVELDTGELRQGTNGK